MSFMEELFDHFADEIEGVDEYSSLSMEHKDDPELKKMFYEMAAAELDHAKKLQGQIEKLSSEPVPPEDAVKILEEIRKAKQEQMRSDLAKAKSTLDMAK